MQEVSFQTDDNVTILADFYSPIIRSEGDLRAVMLLHMMPETKSSFREFAEKLIDIGFYALALDLRGHGKSVNQEGRRLDYNVFTDVDHQASIKDVKSAGNYLQKKGLKVYAVIGASIGANLALLYQSQNEEVSKSVLLSAGFNYRGILTQPLVLELSDRQGVYFIGGSQDFRVSARDSGQSAGQVAKSLFEQTRVADKKLEVIETSEHGTDLFKFDPTLSEKIFSWLRG